MPRRPTRKLRAAPFIPTSSHMGAEGDFILRGENMWIQTNRAGSSFATQYKGSADQGERIPSFPITGTLSWTKTSKTITGSGTSFLTELHLGTFLLVVDDGDSFQTRELWVVEAIESDTSMTVTAVPTISNDGTGYGVIMPVMWTQGTKRATALRGNTMQFPKGHILGVGDGTLRLDGQKLSTIKGSGDDLELDRAPRLAFYNPSSDDYSQNNVGISLPDAGSGNDLITITAVSEANVTGATNATPIVVTASGHGLSNGEVVTIEGVGGNTAANGTFLAANVSGATFELTDLTGANVAGNGAYTSGGVVNPASQMQAGKYNIRVTASNTETLGHSNPSDVIAPVTLTAGQSIKIVFNAAMSSNQNAWDVYGTEFLDQQVATTLPEFNGPWYKVTQITSTDLGGTGASTSKVIKYSDAEINASINLLSFDNFAPTDAEFVDIINGIPIYMSCLGQGRTAKLNGSSPGPVAIPSKPSNPEAVFLNKAITTANADYILGSFNTKGRLFALCQNSLQTVILTSLDFEPITFRSLWDAGFRNPYNAVFVKEYLYAFSTQKIIRSVAGGDDSQIEFDFASDVRDYVLDFDVGRVLAGYDPKNRAVCFFISAYEKRTDHYVTIVPSFRLDTQVWNPPMVIKVLNRDMIVSGVATVGDKLFFLSGGARNATDALDVHISSSTDATPIVVTTSTNHGFSDGDTVLISGHTTNTNANGAFIVANKTATTFELTDNAGNNVAGNGSGAGSGGICVDVPIDTYEFDAVDSETKDWYLSWNFTDNGDDEAPKIIKGLSATGRFTSGLTEVHGIRNDDNINLTEIEDGHGTSDLQHSWGTNATLKRLRRVMKDWGPYNLWTMRMSGQNTDGADRFDELVVAFDQNSSET